MSETSRLIDSRIRALSGYVPGEQPGEGSTLIKLNTNENPYPASPAVAQAVAAAAARLHLYPEPLSNGLRKAAAHAWGVEEKCVIVGNGSDEILSLCVKACTRAGERIAFPSPTYSLYRTLAELAGCEVVEAPSRNGAVPRAISTAGARITFLCTPNSPYGYEISRDTIREVASASPGLVVVDEAYVDFGGTSALPLLSEFDNLLVLRTLSKSYSLAGARIGFGIAREDLIAELCKVKDSYNVSRLAQAAGEAALADTAWMKANVDRICRTRERARGELLSRGFEVLPSAANFLWVECGPGGGAEAYQRLRGAGVLVRAFDTAELRSGIRVTVGTDEQMDVFLAAMAGPARDATRSA